MQEKKKQYILDDLLRIILAMFVLTVLFAFSCLLLSHGARGIWLAVLAQFTLLGVLGGVFLRRCLRIVQKNEQVMQLYAAGYTIADICHLKCYFSRGTEMALKRRGAAGHRQAPERQQTAGAVSCSAEPDQSAFPL